MTRLHRASGLLAIPLCLCLLCPASAFLAPGERLKPVHNREKLAEARDGERAGGRSTRCSGPRCRVNFRRILFAPERLFPAN